MSPPLESIRPCGPLSLFEPPFLALPAELACPDEAVVPSVNVESVLVGSVVAEVEESVELVDPSSVVEVRAGSEEAVVVAPSANVVNVAPVLTFGSVSLGLAEVDVPPVGWTVGAATSSPSDVVDSTGSEDATIVGSTIVVLVAAGSQQVVGAPSAGPGPVLSVESTCSGSDVAGVSELGGAVDVLVAGAEVITEPVAASSSMSSVVNVVLAAALEVAVCWSSSPMGKMASASCVVDDTCNELAASFERTCIAR